MQRGHIFLAERDLTRFHLLETGDGLQDSRFAAAGFSHQDAVVTRGHLEADVFQSEISGLQCDMVNVNQG